MSQIPSGHGGGLGLRDVRGALVAGVFDRTLDRHPELNYDGLARLLGLPASSAQNYRDGKSSPSVDRARVVCWRRLTPDDFVLDLLQSMGGSRVHVELVDASEVPRATRPANVMKELIHALVRFDALLQDAYERTGDGDVSADDAAAIVAGWSDVRKAGDRAVRFSQFCANGGRR